MRCAAARRWISDRLDGPLDPRKEKRLEGHLATCPACREFSRDFEAIVREARELRSPEPSATAWSNILAGVREAGKTPAPARREKRPAVAWSPAVLRYAAAALILAAAAGLAVMLGPWPGAGNGGRSVAFTIAKLEEAQRYYEKAIRSLSEAVAVRNKDMNPELAEVFQRNLEAMDATIQACRTFVAKDPEDPSVRAYLLTAYREKVSFLEEMMGAERASVSAKTEIPI